MEDRTIAIVGGCGHVGLPLGLSFAKAGLDVHLYDIDAGAVAAVSAGKMPFQEEGGPELLAVHLKRNLFVGSDPSVLQKADVVVCVIGTPVDEYLNPRLNRLLQAVEDLKPFLSARQLFVLRSTVYPGATTKVAERLQAQVPGIDVAFCPERVTQGYAIRETATTPQIIAGVGERARARGRALFAKVCSKLIDLEPSEAELAKLFCNSYRYISFALANQFYAVCMENGLDYYRVWEAVTEEYPRMRGLPKAGFAAGPCLFKDTMQLSAFFNSDFSLGQAAMLVNEGLPRLLVRHLKDEADLRDKKVGILGLAFKGDSDDVRESLAFKLRKLLSLECREVLCTDSHIKQTPDLVSLERVLAEADILVIGAPHSEYKNLRPKQPVLDVWNLLGRGGVLHAGSDEAKRSVS